MKSAIMCLLTALALCLQMVPRVPAEAYLGESDTSAVTSYRASRDPVTLNDQLFQFPEKKYAVAASRYCGVRLSNTLDILCRGSRSKKSSADMQEMSFWSAYAPVAPPSLDEEGKIPFRPRSASPYLISALRKRASVGIIEECCRNSCTLDQLRSYCW